MKKPSKILKLCFLLIISSSLFLCPIADADIPVIDPAEILQIIKDGIQEMKQFEETVQQRIQQMTLNGLVGDRNIQNQNNLAANEIVRLTQNATDLFNKKLRMDSRPAITACSTASIAHSLNDNFCITHTLINSLSKGSVELSQGGDPSKPYLQNLVNSVNSSIKEQQQLSSMTGNKNAGLNASALMNPNSDGYSKNQQKEADYTRRLILNPLPAKNPISHTQRTTPNLPFIEQKERVQQDVYTARKSVAANALAAIQAERTKDSNGISQLGMMEKFVQDRFLSKSWIEKITNTHPDKSNKNNVTTPAQVQREIAVMDSFGNYVDVKNLKANQRTNVLLATILSLELDNAHKKT